MSCARRRSGRRPRTSSKAVWAERADSPASQRVRLSGARPGRRSSLGSVAPARPPDRIAGLFRAVRSQQFGTPYESIRASLNPKPVQTERRQQDAGAREPRVETGKAGKPVRKPTGRKLIDRPPMGRSVRLAAERSRRRNRAGPAKPIAGFLTVRPLRPRCVLRSRLSPRQQFFWRRRKSHEFPTTSNPTGAGFRRPLSQALSSRAGIRSRFDRGRRRGRR